MGILVKCFMITTKLLKRGNKVKRKSKLMITNKCKTQSLQEIIPIGSLRERSLLSFNNCFNSWIQMEMDRYHHRELIYLL